MGKILLFVFLEVKFYFVALNKFSIVIIFYVSKKQTEYILVLYFKIYLLMPFLLKMIRNSRSYITNYFWRSDKSGIRRPCKVSFWIFTRVAFGTKSFLMLLSFRKISYNMIVNSFKISCLGFKNKKYKKPMLVIFH